MQIDCFRKHSIWY